MGPRPRTCRAAQPQQTIAFAPFPPQPLAHHAGGSLPCQSTTPPGPPCCTFCPACSWQPHSTALCTPRAVPSAAPPLPYPWPVDGPPAPHPWQGCQSPPGPVCLSCAHRRARRPKDCVLAASLLCSPGLVRPTNYLGGMRLPQCDIFAPQFLHGGSPCPSVDCCAFIENDQVIHVLDCLTNFTKISVHQTNSRLLLNVCHVSRIGVVVRIHGFPLLN